MWITTAWQCISPELIVKGFMPCCISSAMDENDDEMLCNGSEETGNARRVCKEDEGTDCEDGDSDTDWYS
jgi:hypothetical protein